MKKSILGFALVILFGCASNNGQFDEIDGFLLSDNSQTRSNFFYIKYKPPKASRAPASVGYEQEEYSNKEIYFLGLWQQKKKMESILGYSSDNVCPAFHNLLLETRNERDYQNGNYNLEKNWNKIFSSHNPVANPVMALKSSEGSNLFSIYKDEGSIDKADVVEAVESFYKSSNEEVEKLCDTGSSEGYFVFTNLVEYYSGQNFMRSEQALKALLKVSPVANYYVLNSLSDSKSFVHADKFEMMTLKKLNASWFNNYLEKAYNSGNRKVSSVSSGSEL